MGKVSQLNLNYDKKPSVFAKSFSSAPPQRMLILVEGAVTEKVYLTEFLKKFKMPTDRIAIKQTKEYTPLGMVKTAVAELAYAPVYQRLYNKPGYEEVWVVCDRDTHDSFEDAVALASEVEHLYLVPSNPCFEIWLLHHFSARRKAFVGKGHPIGQSVVTETILPDGNIREEVVTTYAPANPSILCQEAFEKVAGQSKRLEKVGDLLDLQRLNRAMQTDFPISERQDGKECWSLMPHLLLRLLSFRYSAQEVAKLFPRSA